MYTILVADGEAYIRKGIPQKLKKLSDHVSIIGEAENGEEALTLTERLHPDIVITDSRLPRLDGLNFIERAKEKGLQTHFIIASEFDNFSYVQKALRLGVHDYLLKPVNNDNLCKAVSAVCRLIDAERAAQQKGKRPLLAPDGGCSTLQRYADWSELAKAENVSDALCRASAQRQGASFPYRLFTVFTVELSDYLHHKASEDEEPVLAQFSAASCFEKELSDYGKLQCFVQESPSSVCCLFNHELSDPEVETLLDRCAANAAVFLKLSCVVGALEARETFPSLKELCAQAETLCAQTVTLTEQRVIRTQDLSRLSGEVYVPGQPITDSLLKLIRTDPANEERMEGLFETMLSGMVSCRMTYGAIQNTCREILKSVTADLEDKAIDHGVPVYWEEFEQALLLCRTIPDFCRAMTHAAAKIGQHIQRNDLSEGKKIVSKIKARLEKEYYRDLKLSMFASDYYINQSYLSILFQHETGVNYSQYLARIRLEKAKELLEKTNLSTGKVAELTGYNDRNYFAAVFSKKFGMTPVQYRTCMTSGRMQDNDQVV